MDARVRKRATNLAYNRALRRLQVTHPTDYERLYEEELVGLRVTDQSARNAAGFRARSKLGHLHSDDYHRYLDEERALLGIHPVKPTWGRAGPASGKDPHAPADTPAWLPELVQRYGRRSAQLWEDLSESGRHRFEELLADEKLLTPG